MKSSRIKKKVRLSVGLLLLTSVAAHAMPYGAQGQLYLGAFGGGGSSNTFQANQFATALFTEASGGPFAVNAFGHAQSHSVWLAGGQMGYQVPEIVVNAFSTAFALVPAAELEGYYLGNGSYKANNVNNTTRLPQHKFRVTYPQSTAVFLTNAQLGFNLPYLCSFHPYLGLGIGGGILSISSAKSAQIAPAEPGINHFNARASDSAPAFAGQVKVGLSYEISKCASLFAEYRWLYLSSTHYTFGSTVYTGHAVTTSWLVKLGHQEYNMGTVGIRFNIS